MDCDSFLLWPHDGEFEFGVDSTAADVCSDSLLLCPAADDLQTPQPFLNVSHPLCQFITNATIPSNVPCDDVLGESSLVDLDSCSIGDLAGLQSLSPADIDLVLGDLADDGCVDATNPSPSVSDDTALLRALSHDHDYAEQSDWKILSEFMEQTDGVQQFVDDEDIPACYAKDDGLTDDPTFMDTRMDIEQFFHELQPTVAVAVEANDGQQTEDALYRTRRDRNNEASRKSRANRKAKFQRMKTELTEEQDRRLALLEEVQRLQKLRDEWKDKLMQLTLGGRKK